MRCALSLVFVALVLVTWMNGADLSKPAPAIPTFPTDDLARTGFFYAGGKYEGEPGKEVMGDTMYTEVWVPRQVRHPYPIVFFHGNGQTGAVWRQTPDNRAGWAYYLVSLRQYLEAGEGAPHPDIDFSRVLRGFGAA